MTTKVIDLLNALIQLDYDAVLAYTRAIDGVDEAHHAVRHRLVSFRADHERHVVELSQAVARLHGEVKTKRRDLKGLLIEGMTAAQALLGTHGALLAMRTNEELTNRRYDAALQEDLPADVRALLLRARDDERRHAEWIEGAIERQVWIDEARAPL